MHKVYYFLLVFTCILMKKVVKVIGTSGHCVQSTHWLVKIHNTFVSRFSCTFYFRNFILRKNESFCFVLDVIWNSYHSLMHSKVITTSNLCFFLQALWIMWDFSLSKKCRVNCKQDRLWPVSRTAPGFLWKTKIGNWKIVKIEIVQKWV